MCTDALTLNPTRNSPPLDPSSPHPISPSLLEQAINIHTTQTLLASLNIFIQLADNIERQWREQPARVNPQLGAALVKSVLQFKQPGALSYYELLTDLTWKFQELTPCDFLRSAYPLLQATSTTDDDGGKEMVAQPPPLQRKEAIRGYRRTDLYRLRYLSHLFELLGIEVNDTKAPATSRSCSTTREFTKRLQEVIGELQLDLETALVGRCWSFSTSRGSMNGAQYRSLTTSSSRPPKNKSLRTTVRPDKQNSWVLDDYPSQNVTLDIPPVHQSDVASVSHHRSEQTPSTAGSLEQTCDSTTYCESSPPAPADPISQLLEMISAPRAPPNYSQEDIGRESGHHWLEVLPGLWLVAHDEYVLDYDVQPRCGGRFITHVLNCTYKVPVIVPHADRARHDMVMKEGCRPRTAAARLLRACLFITQSMIYGGNLALPFRPHSADSTLVYLTLVGYLMLSLALPVERALGLAESFLTGSRGVAKAVQKPGQTHLAQLYALARLLSRAGASAPTSSVREEDEEDEVTTCATYPSGGPLESGK